MRTREGNGTINLINKVPKTGGYVDSSGLFSAKVRYFGYLTDVGGGGIGLASTASHSALDVSKDSGFNDLGAFLVRAASVSDTGSTAALLGVGILVLGAAR